MASSHKWARVKRRGGRAAGRSRRRLNETPTPAEAALARALDDIGEPYSTNYTVRTADSMSGYYLVDFRLPRRKLYIELDGKPHTSLRAQWNDRLRTEAILRATPKYELIRAWNSDVLKNPEEWVDRHILQRGANQQQENATAP